MGSLVRIALRNVLRNRRRSLITLSAVFLAVGVMTSVRGLLNGLQAAIREGVIATQTGAVQVHRKGFLKSLQASLDLDLPADDAFLGRIRAVEGVTAVSARIPFGGMVNANDRTLFTIIQAFDPENEPKVCPQRFDVLGAGRRLDPALPDGADVAGELLRRLGAPLGATLAVLTNDHDGVLNAAELKAVGSLGGSALPLPDQKVVFVPLALAQELLRMPGRATEIAVAVRDPDRVAEVAKRIASVVGPEYEVSSWHEVAPFIDEVIQMQNFVLNLIAWIFMIIALLGIANTMLMNVLERTREVGTMMSVGMRRRQILLLFLAEAALLGLLGGVLGGALGGGFVLRFHGDPGLPIPLPTGGRILIHTFITVPYLLWVFGLAALGAALAALYPAWWASRLRPVEALSHA